MLEEEEEEEEEAAEAEIADANVVAAERAGGEEDACAMPLV